MASTPTHKSKRPSTTGVKALITVSSVAATLMGWALITNQDQATATDAAKAATQPVEAVAQDVAGPNSPTLAPLPTVAPLTDARAQSLAQVASTNPAANQPTPTVQPTTRPLRTITARPVARSRSSR